MSSVIHAYVPPIDDMLHALEVAGAGHIEATEFGLMGDGQINETELRPFLESAGNFAAEKWAPTNATGDRSKPHTFVPGTEPGQYNEVHFAPSLKNALNQYVQADYIGVAAPAEWGGLNAPKTIGMALTEIFNSANLALCLGPLLTEGAIEDMHIHGSDDLKRKFMTSLVSGESFGTMLLTETDRGTDLGRLKTVARKQEDGTYHLQGQKIFITFGEHDAAKNIVHIVLARTGKPEDGIRGLSLFAVPKFMTEEDGTITDKRNGIEAIELHEKMGIHASPTCVMELGGDKGPAVGYLIGKEGEGMKNMFTMMNNARQRVGISGVGLAERALQAGIRYAAQRRQGDDMMSGESNVHIIRHANQKEDISISAARIMASRMICYHASALGHLAANSTDPEVREKSDRMCGLFTPIAKAGSTTMGYEVASTALQMTGGFGYMEESGFPQYVRDAMILQIYEGTNAIQALDLIGRKMLKDSKGPAATVREWIEESRREIRKAEERFDSTHRIFASTSESLKLLDDATSRILHIAMKGKIEQALTTAENYLTMFDRVAGGVMMARSAAIALDKARTPKTAYYLQMAHTYADNILPETLALLPKIRHGAKSVLNTDMNHILSQTRTELSP